MSLRDEIKTTEFGIVVINLLCLVGILSKEKISNTITKWGLDRNWEQRRMLLFVDGISLDRHEHFQNKLSNAKVSFMNAFKQSITF